jgi:hypothetical protein
VVEAAFPDRDTIEEGTVATIEVAYEILAAFVEQNAVAWGERGIADD